MDQQSDPLFRRFTLEEEIVFDNQAALETDNNNNKKSHNNALALIPAADILQALGGALDQADQALEELSSNDLLGSAIFRGCRDLADAVGHLAQQLDDQSQDDRRALANACLQDVHDVNNNNNNNNNNNSQQKATTSTSSMSSSPQMQELSNMTAEDIMSALSGASTLLRDVEMGLRGIEQDEAEEIADVALTLARLFVASLQTVHSTLVHQEQMDQKKRLEEQANRFEVLSDDDDDDVGDSSSVDGGDMNDDNQNTKTRRTGREHEKSSSQSAKSSTHPSSAKLCHDRLRVLWPPIGPAVASACEWGKEEAIKQPMLAVALGMTLWPAAVVTAFLGTPLVVGDAIAQHAYNSFQDGPIVSNVEKGAAQVFQCAKLSLLCGKLVGRQSMRVINRQIERNGGIGTIAQNLGGMAVDRVLHPAETACAVWDGLQWGFGILRSNWQHVMEHHNHNDEEGRDALTIHTDDEWGKLIN